MLLHYILIVLFAHYLVVDSQGVYFYRNIRTGRVHYVGKTNNFERRNLEHIRARRYFADANSFRMDVFYTKYKDTVEKYYIERYDPVANIIK